MRHEHAGPATPSWVERMTPGRWYRISGDRPDLDLGATPAGTRYLADNDPALEYAPNLDRFVYYSTNHGPQVYSIASPAGSTWPQLVAGAWTWRSLLNEGNHLDPVTQSAAFSSYGVNVSHTFGRFRVATYDQTDVAILVRHTDTPVYAMRLN